MEAKELITCVQCGHQVSFQQGFLTEDQKGQYKCQPCLTEPVLERQVTEREHDGKRLLVEG